MSVNCVYLENCVTLETGTKESQQEFGNKNVRMTEEESNR